jgi:hypothetical protein
MRLGELLSTRHCDWHAGRGETPFIEVVPRQDHPAGVRCKSGRYRRIYVSDKGRCDNRPFAELAYSAWLEHCSLPVCWRAHASMS